MRKQPFRLCERTPVCCFSAAVCPCFVAALHGFQHLCRSCISLDPRHFETRVFQLVGAAALFLRILAFHESECWNSSFGKIKFDFDRKAPRTSVVYNVDWASLDRKHCSCMICAWKYVSERYQHVPFDFHEPAWSPSKKDLGRGNEGGSCNCKQQGQLVLEIFGRNSERENRLPARWYFDKFRSCNRKWAILQHATKSIWIVWSIPFQSLWPIIFPT